MKRAGQTYAWGARFESITRALRNPFNPDAPYCPKCEHLIDFSEDLKWMGPTAFVCKNCGEIIELSELKGF
ncbi:MAG: hypothetical protein ACXADO_10305 [Candidatus Thorarchaeota archaeon]|jgi:hypothetical protein